MKKLFVLPILMAALFSPFAVNAGVEGSVSVDSDYFWRGVSQNNGDPALSFNLEYMGDGFYAGTWGSQVNYGGDKDYEWDFYAGYALNITDAMILDVGLIHYTYDTLKPDLEEVYAKLHLGNWSFSHHVDIDHTDRTFTEVEYLLPFISQVDVSLLAAMHSEENAEYFGAGENEKYLGMKLSKDITSNLSLNLMVMDGARHGKVMDNASVGFQYNF